MNIVHDNKTERFMVLFALYIASNADCFHAMNVERLGESRGVSGASFRKVFHYLAEEGFLERKDGGTDFLAVITHKGVKVVEEVFLDQYEQTYYFPPYRDMMR